MNHAEPRLFIAVAVPDALKDQLHERCRALRGQFSFKKWVHAADYHITVKFLGSVPHGTASRIKPALEPSTAMQRAFTLGLGGVGCFGKPSSPRILWAKVTGELEPLADLQKNVELAMKGLGFAMENRPYRPHLTLAKTYAGAAPLIVSDLEHAASQFPPLPLFEVKELVLYQTHLGREPMYEPVVTYPLKG